MPSSTVAVTHNLLTMMYDSSVAFLDLRTLPIHMARSELNTPRYMNGF